MDPVGYQSDLNLCAYVENNPINRTDPPGLWFLQIAGGGVNMAAGAIVSFWAITTTGVRPGGSSFFLL
jgi:hypothetical protein